MARTGGMPPVGTRPRERSSMNFAAINLTILDLEVTIARQCATLDSLRSMGPPVGASWERAVAELDRSLLSLREAQSERGKLLIAAGFPVALGWASRRTEHAAVSERTGPTPMVMATHPIVALSSEESGARQRAVG